MSKIKKAHPGFLSPGKTYLILTGNNTIKELVFKKQTMKCFTFHDVENNQTYLITKDKRYSKTIFYHTKKDVYIKMCQICEWRIEYYHDLIINDEAHIAYSQEGLANKIDENIFNLTQYDSLIEQL